MQGREETGRQTGRRADRFKPAPVQPSKTKITRGISGPGRAKITGRNQRPDREMLERFQHYFPGGSAPRQARRPPAPEETKHAEQPLKPPLAGGFQPGPSGSSKGAGGVQTRRAGRAGRSCAQRALREGGGAFRFSGHKSRYTLPQ